MLGSNGCGYPDDILYDDEDPRRADDEYYGQTFEVGRLFYNQSQIIPQATSSSVTLTSEAVMDLDQACNALTKADCNAYPSLREEVRNMYSTFVLSCGARHRPRPVLTSIAVLLTTRRSDLQHSVPVILFTDIVQYLGTVEGYKTMDSYRKPAVLTKLAEKLYGSKDIPHANLDALIERILVRCCCWTRSCCGSELFDAAKRIVLSKGHKVDELPESKRCGVIAASVVDACEECHWKYKNNENIMKEIGANRCMLYKYRKLLPSKREALTNGDSGVSPSSSSPSAAEEDKKRKFSARGFSHKSIEKRRKALNTEAGLVSDPYKDAGISDLTIDLDTVYVTPSSSSIPKPTLADLPLADEVDKLFDMDDFFV